MFSRRIIFFFAILILSSSIVLPVQAAQSIPQAAAPGDCRFGITIASWGFMDTIIPNESVSRYDLSTLGVGYYLDWGLTRDPTVNNIIHYTYVLSVKDGYFSRILSDLPDLVNNNPGSIWIIGNEPDSPNDQDNVTAETYADRFFAYAKLIRANDPTAKISFGTLTMMTKLRLRYLDYAWAELISLTGSRDAASALVDLWTPHGFILNEDPSQGWGAFIPPAKDETVYAEYLGLAEKTNVDWIYSFTKFKERLTLFRQWMKTNGEQNKPLWLTEFGNLLPPYNTPGGNDSIVPYSVTIDFMNKTFDWMYSSKDVKIGDPNDSNRLVQKWFWYSLNDLVTHFGGTLIDPTTRIDTPVGTAFRNYNPPLDSGTSYPATAVMPIAVTVKATSRNLTNRSLVNYIVTVRVRNYNINDFLAKGALTTFENNSIIDKQAFQTARCGGDAVITFSLKNIKAFMPHSYMVRVQISGQSTTYATFNLPATDFTYPNENYFPRVVK